MTLRGLRRRISISLPSSGNLGRETVFDILKNKRRRYAYHYLRQTEGETSLADLSEHVAAWENDTTIEDISSDARQRVYISLLQTHLPKLADRDVIEFDEDRRTVALSENASSMRIFLETVPENDILWAHYYLGVSAIGAGFIVLILQGVQPFAEYDLIVYLLIVAAFLVSSIIHHLYLSDRELGIEGPPPTEL